MHPSHLETSCLIPECKDISPCVIEERHSGPDRRCDPRYAGSVTHQRPYPSDLSDARWTLIEPTLSAWRAERRHHALDIGRPCEHDLRAIMNAILYVDRTGIPGATCRTNTRPGRPSTATSSTGRTTASSPSSAACCPAVQLTRTNEGRDPEPTTCLIDAQSVKTSANVPASSQGYDSGKKIAGRKRSIVTDTLGLLIAVLVTAASGASVSDGAAGLPLPTQVAANHPTITKTRADSAYRTTVIEGGAALGIDLEVVRRDPATRGFTALPRRWVAERTLGWLMLHRRLVHDYEALPARSEAMIHVAMIDLMTRRLTRESTPTWRGT